MPIIYNDATSLHSQNLERPRTDVRTSGVPISVNAEVVLALNGETSWVVTIIGAYSSGLYIFEGSFDGLNYISIPMFNPLNETWHTQPVTTTQGQFVGNCAGMRCVRVRVTTVIAGGTPTVSINASLGINLVRFIPLPSTLAVTNTGVSGAAVTLTLAAPGIGLYHYLTRIVIQRFAVALLTAGATPVLVTTTNLPGTRVFSVPADAAAQGTIYCEVVSASQPLKSSAANVATTIVCPATTNTIWRVTADYYSAA